MTFQEKLALLSQTYLYTSERDPGQKLTRTPTEVLNLILELPIPQVQRLTRLSRRLGMVWVVERFCVNALYDPSDVMRWVGEEEAEHAKAVAELAALTKEQDDAE